MVDRKAEQIVQCKTLRL